MANKQHKHGICMPFVPPYASIRINLSGKEICPGLRSTIPFINAYNEFHLSL